MFKYFGAKHYLLNDIYRYLPAKFDAFVDVFGGSGKVLMSRRKSCDLEIYNDLSTDLATTFRVVKSPQFDELKSWLSQVKYCKSSWRFWRDEIRITDDIQTAIRTFVVNQMSFSGNTTSFSTGGGRVRRGMNQSESGYLSCIDKIPTHHSRLTGVLISNLTFDAIHGLNTPETFWYCDPPYLHATRYGGNEYRHEMTGADHVRFLMWAKNRTGKVMISGYANVLYDVHLHGWRRIKCPKPNFCANQNKTNNPTMPETLWMNY